MTLAFIFCLCSFFLRGVEFAGKSAPAKTVLNVLVNNLPYCRTLDFHTAT